MKFWEYNSNKVLFMAALTFLAGAVILILTGAGETDPVGVVMFSAVICAVFTGTFVIRGINHFRTMRRITTDTSDRSILSLFDDGYSVVLNNENSRLFYTTERLKGEISGFPVIVSFEQGSRASWPTLVFSFFPLNHPTLGNRTSAYYGVKLSLRNRLRKDVKPDVLRFAKDLRDKRYSSAEYSQYFVTAN